MRVYEKIGIVTVAVLAFIGACTVAVAGIIAGLTITDQ